MMRTLLLALTLGGGIAAADAVSVREAWIALPPPGATVAAGYLVIDNPSTQAIRVVAVRAAGFARAEIHETMQQGARLVMRRRADLEVTAGARVALAPGAIHLMLFDPAAPPVVGRSHTITLRLADGRELVATAVVRDARIAPDAASSAAHH